MSPKEFKISWPKLGRGKGAQMTSTALARRGWSVPWLSCRFTEKMCLKSVLLGLPDPNEANATGSLSTHFGFTRLTKSCVTYEQSEPVSNITVASVTPWLPCTVTRANCNATDGYDADMSPGGVELATLMTDVVDDECVADAFTLPLDGGGGGDDTLLTPAEVGPIAGGPHVISWWRPLHFHHTTLHPFAICPGNKHRKHKPADFNFSFFTWMDPLNLKHFSVGWFFPQKQQVLLGFTVEVAWSAEAVATLGRRSSMEDLKLGPKDSWNICDLSLCWISFTRKDSKNLRSLSCPLPSRDHSSLNSCGTRLKIRGVRMILYLSPSIPRVAKERVCACKSSFNFQRADTEHLEGTDKLSSFWICVKIIVSLRPNLSLSILHADA